MRTMEMALLLLIAGTNIAFADTESRVFAHECSAIDSKKTGFECSVSPSGLMRIYWQEDPTAMSPQRRKNAEYEADRLVIRYFDLGFTRFLVRNDAKGKDRMRACARTRHSGYHWSCTECDLSGKNCKEQ